LITAILNYVQTLLDEWIAHCGSKGGNNANVEIKSI
jgi:hypothetical protein